MALGIHEVLKALNAFSTKAEPTIEFAGEGEDTLVDNMIKKDVARVLEDLKRAIETRIEVEINEPLHKAIEESQYFIKAQDKKIEADLKREMFITISATNSKNKVYSIHFPFVFSSHPHKGTKPICQEEWVKKKAKEAGAIVEVNDNVLLSACTAFFKPTAGLFIVHRRAVIGEEIWWIPEVEQAFETLFGVMRHFEGKFTSQFMLEDFIRDKDKAESEPESEPKRGYKSHIDHKPSPYNCQRALGIIARHRDGTVESYLKELDESHKSKIKEEETVESYSIELDESHKSKIKEEETVSVPATCLRGPKPLSRRYLGKCAGR